MVFRHKELSSSSSPGDRGAATYKELHIAGGEREGILPREGGTSIPRAEPRREVGAGDRVAGPERRAERPLGLNPGIRQCEPPPNARRKRSAYRNARSVFCLSLSLSLCPQAADLSRSPTKDPFPVPVPARQGRLATGRPALAASACARPAHGHARPSASAAARTDLRTASGAGRQPGPLLLHLEAGRGRAPGEERAPGSWRSGPSEQSRLLRVGRASPSSAP